MRRKNLSTRPVKLARAKKLELDHPQTAVGPLNLLFICSRNQWRSPTAEHLWRKRPNINARSAGTSPNARHRVSIEDIRWSDIIFVMEEKHKSRLIAEFAGLVDDKPIHILDIPDDYKYMDPELVEMLEQSVDGVLRGE